MSRSILVFAACPHGPPVASVTPCLEALISVRLGDDPRAALEFWQHLVYPVISRVPYVADNRIERGPLLKADVHQTSVRDALTAACVGPGRAPSIEWSTLTFTDVGDPDALPAWSATCALGWIGGPTAARGISLRITVPPESGWPALLELALELARRWPRVWRWMTVGPRFQAVSMHSTLFEGSLQQIRARSRRFVLVDIGEPFGLYTSLWQDQLRTVAWCTLLSPDLAARLPSPPVKAASVALEVIPSGAGLLLRAGGAPILGDINRREELSAYHVMDELVRPVRASEGVHFLGPWDVESSRAWLDRLAPAVRS